MRIYSCVKEIFAKQNNGILFSSELNVIITQSLYETISNTWLLCYCYSSSRYPVSLPLVLVNVLVVIDHPEKKGIMVGNSLLCHRVQDYATADSHII